MALLEDYTKLLHPTAIPSDGSALAGTAPSGGLQPLTPKSFLPTTTYNVAPPGAQRVAPTLVNFNPQNLPAGYQAGSMPTDWQSIIASNPDYMNWQLGAQKTADEAASQRRAALRALSVRFGGLPSNFSDVYGDIDPETAKLAAENPESENARLLRSYTDQVEQTRRQLAARGMLQSGEFGYSQDQLDLARQGDIYNLNNQFLDTAQGAVNSYAGVVGGLNADQIDQIRAASERIRADKLYQAQLTAAQQAAIGQGFPTSGPPSGPTSAPPVTQPAKLPGFGGYASAEEDPIWQAYQRAGYKDADLRRMYRKWYTDQASFGLGQAPSAAAFNAYDIWGM